MKKANSTGKTRPTKNTDKDLQNKDITDPRRDQDKLQGDEATLDLPEIKDIPAVVNVDPALIDDPLAMNATVASDDEEGKGVLDDLNTTNEDDEDTIVMGTEADVSPEEVELLDKAEHFSPSKDEETLERSAMDTTDNDGEPLNEKGFAGNLRGGDRSGSDLDIPGAEDDDLAESIGEEDEENNPYSLGADKEDINESDRS